MKLSYINLYTTDPEFNLAAEQYVFDVLPRDRMYFMLWQNDNAIIIGKYQNTHAEINEPFVREHGIKVVRRLSGGGAVYHDMGNLNFTFIMDAGNVETLDLHLFCEPIAKSLQSIGVNAVINGRNDITIDGRKFSGNSQYMKQGRVMHHGTIMFSSDLGIVNDALKVDADKIKAKGIKSVRSRVTNVSEHLSSDITLEEFRSLLLNNIIKDNNAEEYILSPADIETIEKIRAERYSKWEWNYGFSPECTMHKKKRFEGVGTVEAMLTVEKGEIKALSFYGDFFSTDTPEALAARFIGLRPLLSDYETALEGVDVGRYFTNMTTEQLIELLN